MRRTAGRGWEAPWARNAGGAATRARARAVREAIEAAEALTRGVGGSAGGFAPAAGAGAGPAAVGAVGVGHAAVAGMVQQGPFTTFNSMLTSHDAYTALPDDAKEAFLRLRGGVGGQQPESAHERCERLWRRRFLRAVENDFDGTRMTIPRARDATGQGVDGGAFVRVHAGRGG